MAEVGGISENQVVRQEASTLFYPPLVELGELGEGITARVKSVVYTETEETRGFYPPGLGKWVRQTPVWETKHPPLPGQWVKEPKPLDMLAVKVIRHAGNPQLGAQLSSERAALLQLQDLFADNAVARPARLYGYGVENGRRGAEAYLILEDVRHEKQKDVVYPNIYQRLKEYLAEKGSLSESETLEIGLKLVFILKKVHEKGITHGDLNDQKLDNIFWNPKNKHVRLIDWANSHFAEVDKQFGRPFAYGYDREGLGRVLFRLITGEYCPTDPRKKGAITHEHWAKMSQPTRDVVGRALYLREDAYKPFEADDTNKMYEDLLAAHKILTPTRS